MPRVNPAPVFRIRVAETYDSALTLLPMQGPRNNGFIVNRFDVNPALPSVGSAVFSRHYGRISGRDYGPPSGDGLAEDGTQNLQGYEVIIEKSEEGGTWSVQFWGQVIAQIDNAFAGSEDAAGMVMYHCRGGLDSLRRFYMDQHLWYGSSLASAVSPGHPGFNAESPTAITIGNRSDRAAATRAFTRAGSADAIPWTDEEVIRECLQGARQPQSGPDNLYDWDITGSLTSMQSARFYEVSHDATAKDIITEVATRAGVIARLVHESIIPDDVSLRGNLEPRIQIMPANYLSVNIDNPETGVPISIPGALIEGTAIDLDFIGIPAIKDGSFQLQAIGDTDFDAVETIGERIEVTATVKLEALWSDDEAEAFAEWGGQSEGNIKFSDAFSLVGVGDDFQFVTLNRGEVTASRFDVSCEGLGLTLSNTVSTSPIAFDLADDLPFRMAWDYSGDIETAKPVPYWDDRDQGAADAPPIPWQIFEKDGASFDDLTEFGPVSMSRSGDDGRAVRLSPGYLEDLELDDVRFTLNFVMPHRIKLINGDETGRIKRVFVPGLKLVLAHNSAMLGVDEDGEVIYPGINETEISGVTFYVIRDDRAELARLHALHVDRFLTNPTKKARFTIQGRYGPGYQGIETGKLLHQITYSGRTETVNTPITRVTYDHDSMETIVSTDRIEDSWSLTSVRRAGGV